MYSAGNCIVLFSLECPDGPDSHAQPSNAASL